MEQHGPIPTPRHDHSAVLVEGSDTMVVWGGTGGYDVKRDILLHYNDIHLFSFTDHTWYDT